MTQLNDLLAIYSREVDDELERRLPAEGLGPSRLHQAMRWSVFAGGKRIRPAILFAAGVAFGAGFDALRTSAAAVEMIHTFSLIHDDLPAMDDDDLRRGRLTCHKKFDEATAILAGDALQVLAFKTIAEDALLAPETRVRLVADLASAAGTPIGMVAGQQLDIEAEGREVVAEDLATIHIFKTGALIRFSAKAGALVGGADDHELEFVDKYATHLGLLFQITDDLLDVTRSTEELGKTAGKDLSAEKATYPGLFGLAGARAMALDEHEAACAALDELERDTATLRAIADLVLDRTT